MRLLFTILSAVAALASAPAFSAACAGFTDVDSANTTYCSAVTYLKDKGITLGCGDGSNYCPNDYVTRLQMALFLQRAGKGGPHNTLGDYTTSIGGGDFNAVSAQYGTIGGGAANEASGELAAIGGGTQNVAGGLGATIAGGLNNTASGDESVVGGGSSNVASGVNATVGGGSNNTAAGTNSVAMGHRARVEATASGSFVFGDSTDIDIGTATADQFLVGASGGIRMLSNKDGTTGCSIVAGGGSWACTSSREVKRDFSPIHTEDVLARALALPVMRWRYMHESPEIRHMGTFSQDFRAAFGLGSDDKSITLVDAEGVSLAAIQGLNAKLEGKSAKLESENADLRARLDRLEAAMAH